MSSKPAFNPDRDIPDLTDKVFLITGGTAGVGREALLKFVQHSPARIFFTGRNAKNGAAVTDEAKAVNDKVEVTYIQCDQDSLASVDAAANTFLAASSRLDVLICNAGIMAHAPGKTADGYEKQFGVNHVAHALLVRRLLPTLQHTAQEHDVRILALSSAAAQGAFEPIEYEALKTTQDKLMGRWRRYSQSKLANVMYANELARRYPELTVVSIHPGVVHSTELQTGLPFAHRAFARVGSIGQWISMEEGGYNTEWAATTDKKNLVTGTFYRPVGEIFQQNKLARKDGACERLWEWTQAELDEFEGRSKQSK